MSEYYKAVTMAEGGGRKSIVSIPAWAQALHEGAAGAKDTINTPAAAYAYVPLVYRAVRLRADALTRVPIYFTKLDGETEVPNPFPDCDFMDLLWKTEAALCLQGANYIEKIQTVRSKKTSGLQWVNPLTMNARMVKSNAGMVYEFQQGTNGAKFNLDTMIYMREFSLLGDMMPNGSVMPGDSSAKVSLNDAALMRYMSRFAARFFESGAMPITVLQVDGIVDKDEADRIQGWFKRAAAGIRNAFSVLALSRAIEPKVISQPLKDLAMPELNQQARHAVALAFGIPQTMLEDAANYATSAEHRLSFWSDTVRPRGDWLAEQFNRQLFHKMGIQMSFGFDELDIFQEDENQRATSLNSIVTAINTNPAVATWAMGVLGYDLNEDQKRELDVISGKTDEGTEGDGETEVTEGAVVASGENVQAQALNGAQVASLVEVLTLVATGQIPRASGVEIIMAAFPIDADTVERMMGEIGRGFKPETVAADAGNSPIPETDEAPAEPVPAKSAYADDLARWERKALRVLKESGSPVCTFESDNIPDSVRERIEAALPDARSAQAVRSLFDIKPMTVTATPEYQPAPEAYALADSINQLAAAYLKSQEVAPPIQQPIVIVNNQKAKRVPIADIFARNMLVSRAEESNE